MRAIWSGAISFGLVNIPVHLYSGSRERGISLHLLHRTDLSPIRYARVCQEDGEEVPYQDVVKAYKLDDGEYVPLSDKDFVEANPKKTQTLDIESFVDEKQIDPIYFEKPYYLGVEEGSERAYALLGEALQKSGRVGMVRYVLRNRERIGILRPHEGLLLLLQLRFPNELVRPKGIKVPRARIARKELTMAQKLIDELTEDFDPRHYHDTYAEELQERVKQKARGIEPKKKSSRHEPAPLPDLMEALKRSLNHKSKKAA